MKRSLILLINLGTPSSTHVSDVKKYLAEFLSDPRVVELPRLFWLPLLHSFVLPLRAKKSAHAYQKIWLPASSPLRVWTNALAEQLQTAFKNEDVHYAMRYGQPSMEEVLAPYQDQLDQLVVLPLYPQYASSSTGSCLTKVFDILSRWRVIPEVLAINQYYNHPLYIQALVDSIEKFWQKNPRGEQLIFSYHGIPQRSIIQGEPYYDQCVATTQAVANALGLAADQYQMVFQSRFGKAKWLEPYCNKTLEALGKSGVQRVEIICPGFSVDCLETLEEIGMQNRDIFLNSGGKIYQYIPCLNDSMGQINLLKELARSCVN